MDIATLNEKFCNFSTYIRGYSPATVRRYRTVIRLFQRRAEITQIAECTESKVREFFYRGRMERGWSANTYATYHKSLVVFFSWCVVEKCLPPNPAEGIEVPKAPRPLPRKLSLQEASRALEFVANARWQSEFERRRNLAILATFLHAGLRKQELLSLHLSDVDLERQVILVRLGKGAKDRLVPTGPTLPTILRAYLAERGRLKKACPQFFTSLNRDHGFTEEGLKRVLKRVRQATGLPIGAHMLRHTFATLMLEGGSDIFSISKMMGHSDIKTTTIYLAATAEHLRAQAMRHPLNYV
jgi:site-specific recombinase XerD